MSAPSGYTALDFVGFTDKGTYSPIVKYMRNDLVHHGGNIMRCKVDDTMNVTPVEGANWELWVGASANLVEKVIAPLENNPADVAFGVGRQIIYDDWLWEVIAPIAVGDALIDYEVDPTNANIKKSAPVETQLLAVKAEADATDNMIAPTEASASSSSAAYSVGDQLILNNILYDVIAAIQIGDAITTGTGGNIAVADTLTDQLNAKANSSDLAAVATSGAYSDLSGTPTLATVATSGSYNDLSNKPTLGTAAAKDSTNAVTSDSTDLVESGAVYTEIQTLESDVDRNIEVATGILGAKNLLPNTATTQTVNGITFTVNSDGSVTASGTATDTAYIDLYISASSISAFNAILSGCPSGGGANSYELLATLVIGGTPTYYRDYGDGVIIPASASGQVSQSNINVRVLVRSGVTINQTFRPMIRPATVASNTYSPYAMTNRELTNDLNDDSLSSVTSLYGTIEGGYKKIGKIVIVNIRLTVNTSIPNGVLVIEGLPAATGTLNKVAVATNSQQSVAILNGSSIQLTTTQTLTSGAVLILSATYVSDK